MLRRWGLPATCFAAGLAGGAALHRRQQPPQQPTPEPTNSAGAVRLEARPNASRVDRPVTVMEAVGNTPLLELPTLSRLTGCKIYAKAEYLNPCGSVKDRAAKYLILDIEEQERLQRQQQPATRAKNSTGSEDVDADANAHESPPPPTTPTPPQSHARNDHKKTIVEATGGNTGVSLALLGAARGYRTLFTMPDKTAAEKIELMRIMGAEVHVQPAASMFDRETHFYHVARRLATELGPDRAAYPNQFENTANMRAHYETTGPEIWRQVGGRLDGFVAAAGTAGTLAGCSRFLKEQDPALRVWMVDPEEIVGLAKFVNDGRSTSFEKDGFEVVPAAQGSTVVEGVGLPRITPNFRLAAVDRGITATNAEIVHMAYFLLRHDGIFVGPSAALNVLGAVKMAQALGPGHTIVTILCDGGDRYRSKLYNPAWLAEQGLTPAAEAIERLSLDFVRT